MNVAWLKFLPYNIRQKLDGRHSIQAIVGNIGWLFLDKIFRATIGLLVGAWVARYLGPSGYGELAYLIAFISIFQAMSKLGMDSIVVRDIAKNPSEDYEVLGSCFRARLISAFFLFWSAIFVMYLLRPGDVLSLGITAILAGTILFQPSETVDLWFQSQSQSKRTVMAKGLSYIGANGFKVFLILVGAPLMYFSIAWLIEAIMSSLALWVVYKNFPTIKSWCWRQNQGRALLVEAWPYLLSSLAIIIYMRIDQIMLGEIAGDHEVGIFSAAVTISEAFYFIPGMLLISLAPMIAKKRISSYASYIDSLRSFFSIMWVLSIVIACGISYFSDLITNLIYGPSFSASAAVLSIHVFALIPVYLGVSSNLWLTNENRGDLGIKQTLLGASINILLNIYLIPKYGALGAAMATLVAFFVSAIFANALFARKLFNLQMMALINFWKFK